ncbi:hypothetical protein [Albidovulum sp.]
MPTGAVLTGDLVGSTSAGRARVDAAMAEVEAAARTAATWCGDAARFTRFRGDGWQFLLADPTLALWAAVQVLARLAARPEAVATRIGIGIGAIDSAGSADLRDAAGSAFVHSGRALDGMSRRERLRIAGDAGAVTGADRAICLLLDERLQRWSRQQAEAAALYLRPDPPAGSAPARPDPPRQAGIAGALGITPQAANQRLHGAGAVAIREALAAHRHDLQARIAR